MRADTPDDTELARRATGGDGQAFGLLFDRWLDRAFDVAWHVVHNRETAADVTQEAFATAWQQIGNLRQPESFGGWLLRITRNKSLNRLQRERRSSPTGSEEALVTLDARQADDPSAPLEQQEHGDLIWAASAALGQEDASLLSLHLRHDLGAPELAEELGVQPNAVHQRLFRLKKRLADAIGAWVLWRGGTPSCPELSAALARAGAIRFDRGTAKSIVGHARGCDTCDSSRQLRLSPEALFAAMPLVPAGPVVRAKVAAALQGSNIPVPSPEPADPQPPEQTGETSGPSDPDETSESGDAAGSDQADGVADAQAPDGTGQPDDTPAAEQIDETSGPSEPHEITEAGEPTGQSAADDVGEAVPPDTVDAPKAFPSEKAFTSRRGRKAVLVGGTVVAAVLIGAALFSTLLSNRAGDGTTDVAPADEVAADEVTERPPRTTTSTSGDPTTTTAPTTTTTATTTPLTATTPADEPTTPGPGSTPTETTAPADTTPSGAAPEPGGADDGNGDAAEPPAIGGFTARSTDRSCGSAREVEAVFAWETSHATSATLGPQGGPPDAVPTTGSVTRCAQPGSTWALTASGPGGTADAQATVPTSPSLATP